MVGLEERLGPDHPPLAPALHQHHPTSRSIDHAEVTFDAACIQLAPAYICIHLRWRRRPVSETDPLHGNRHEEAMPLTRFAETHHLRRGIQQHRVDHQLPLRLLSARYCIASRGCIETIALISDAQPAMNGLPCHAHQLAHGTTER